MEHFINQPTLTSYQVLARKYRPKSIDDLIGQDVLVTTLKQAFESNRIAHAFIFTGMRGVGKTTVARILARAINYASDTIHSPTLESREFGYHCYEILQGSHPDVHEMDAASHTSVEDIRTILQSVVYMPLVARYKVYIIDEVHMLSRSAFNALLKTLEEPPPHVYFIFATTELSKVPLTVLSRCQHFALKRLSSDPDIKNLLTRVTQLEGIYIEEGAIKLLAYRSEGSARDALSLLDQALLYARYTSQFQTSISIKKKDVEICLRFDGIRFSMDILRAIFLAQVNDALTLTSEAHNHGSDLIDIFQNMARLIYALTRKSFLKEDTFHDDMLYLLEEIEGDRNFFYKDIKNIDNRTYLSILWQMINKGILDLKQTFDPLMEAHMLVLRLCYVQNFQKDDFDYSDADEKKDIVLEKNNTKNDEKASIEDFHDLRQHVHNMNDIQLVYNLDHDIQVVLMQKGKLIFQARRQRIGKNFERTLKEKLEKWTGHTWYVEKVDEDRTSKDKNGEKILSFQEKVENHPIVANIIQHFPDLTINLKKKKKNSLGTDSV